MGFKELQSLDAEVTIALGKKNKETGKPYPKQAEGYFLGSRVVENKRGESKLHFLSTPNGNLGIWGTTDLNRKLAQVTAGCMVRITSTGTKPTPNGEMYTYKVEVDSDSTIDVDPGIAAAPAVEDDDSSVGASDDNYDGTDEDDTTDEDEQAAAALLAAERAAKAAKVREIMERKGKKA